MIITNLCTLMRKEIGEMGGGVKCLDGEEEEEEEIGNYELYVYGYTWLGC